MSTNIGLVASNITAALISSGAVPVKDENSKEVVNNAIALYSLVLTELVNRSQAGELYIEP